VFHRVSIRSFLSKTSPFKRAPTLERAEQAYASGNFADAAGLFRALADANSMQAQLRLAQLYERGEGLLQSYVEAVRWLRVAAEQGCVPAMARLGEIFLTGMAAPIRRLRRRSRSLTKARARNPCSSSVPAGALGVAGS